MSSPTVLRTKPPATTACQTICLSALVALGIEGVRGVVVQGAVQMRDFLLFFQELSVHVSKYCDFPGFCPLSLIFVLSIHIGM